MREKYLSGVEKDFTSAEHEKKFGFYLVDIESAGWQGFHSKTFPVMSALWKVKRKPRTEGIETSCDSLYHMLYLVSSSTIKCD